jgi:hypothetical protein
MRRERLRFRPKEKLNLLDSISRSVWEEFLGWAPAAKPKKYPMEAIKFLINDWPMVHLLLGFGPDKRSLYMFCVLSTLLSSEFLTVSRGNLRSSGLN